MTLYRHFWMALALLLVLSIQAWSQDGKAVTKAKAGLPNVAKALAEGLQIQWKGRGEVSGDMLDVVFVNTGSSPVSFGFVTGMVLHDLDQGFQPIILEETQQFILEPRESRALTVRGYCLDFSVEPPADGRLVRYEFAQDLSAYEPAIRALAAGLRLDRNQKFKPVLRPLLHRTVVIQRAIWASLAGKNPTTSDSLLKKFQADNQAKGSPFSEQRLLTMVGGIWTDVESTLAAAPKE